jgi:F-type H+-transporting ATPase subunit b
LKRFIRYRFASLLIALSLFSCAGHFAFSQNSEPSPSTANASSGDNSRAEKMDAPESNSEEQQYRHSATVEWLAKIMHVNTETAAKIFEDFNSGVLIFFILYFLVPYLLKTFRTRTETIQSQIFDARSATEQANSRLSAVEARLSHLDEEVESIRRQAEADTAGDEQRIHQALEEERKRIIESAEHQIDAASAAAQRELKKFAAELAIDRATQGIHLSADADRILVSSFGKNLAGSLGKISGKGGNN